MARRRFETEAEYYRHHRKVFLLALELGVTPVEAEEELDRREAHARWLEVHARLVAMQRGSAGRNTFERWDAPHMMRN